MKLEFDQSVPVHEQLIRVSDYRKPGRKHQKRAGVKASQRKKDNAKRSNAEKLRKQHIYNERVAAYWRGDLECYPK